MSSLLRSPARCRTSLLCCAFAVACAAAGCTLDEAPDGFGTTPEGTGPRVRFDVTRAPFAAPFPSDLFTVPDPSSHTGRRLSFELPETNALARELRRELERLEGFGPTAPITVSLVPNGSSAVAAALELDDLLERHGLPLAFDDDAVYLLDLERGVPVPLDLAGTAAGAFVRDEQVFLPTDARRTEPSLELETADERVDPVTGLPDLAQDAYDPALDADSDGWLDRPNLRDPGACRGTTPALPGTPEDDARDRCLADNLLTSYERDGDTLVLRPLIPLSPATSYAVVLTDRLVDPHGSAVRSPFATVFHPAERATAERVAAILGDGDAMPRFGDLAGTGLDHVAFLWSFTTAPATRDLERIVAGLHGRGDLGALERQFPPRILPVEVVGPIPQAELEGGPPEPAGWELTDDCSGLVGRRHLIPGEVLRSRLAATEPSQLGLRSASELTALVASLAPLGHVALAELVSPFFLAGGPGSPLPDRAFAPELVDGSATPPPDRLMTWWFVPSSGTNGSSEPVDAVVFAHGYASSALEALSVAGALAAQGLATVAFDATGHGPDEQSGAVLEALLRPTCVARGLTAALSTRAVDLDGDGADRDDAGRNARVAHVAHTRDVVRQTAVDLASVVRAVRALGAEPGPAGGDFDGDGALDVGGANASITLFGRSLGGAASLLVGPLLEEVDALVTWGAPGSPVDTWLRTADAAAHRAFVSPWLGPAILGIPADELGDAQTRCVAGELSLRLTALDVDREVPLEFSCVPTAGSGIAASGGTVVVTNLTQFGRSCARIAPGGRFRVGFPASAGDLLRVVLHDRLDAVDTYDPSAGCAVDDDVPTLATVLSWEVGAEPSGADGAAACAAPAGCARFQGQWIASGTPLRAVTPGAGLSRQSPTLRRWLDLARHVAAAGDPGVSSSRLGLAAAVGSPATAALWLTPVGSREVPVDIQLVAARGAGLLPFLPPAAAAGSPELADYVTPETLYATFAEATPLDALVAQRVLEGLPRLARTPPADTCGTNELTAAEAPECHPSCLGDSDCDGGRTCAAAAGNVCALPVPGEAVCRTSLFDPEALDQGRTREGEPESATPLRLARLVRSARDTTIDAVWEPRLAGAPRASDFGAWAADKPTLALLFPYLSPQGRDGLGAGDACAAFDTDRYMLGLVARFLASDGFDPYHLSHPATHACLEDLTCPFFTPSP